MDQARRRSRGTGLQPGSKAQREKRQNPVARISLRGKVWVDVGKTTALTEAGADLLEQIAACGSLSEAARRLGFSYRRAWMLVDAMNRRWHRPLVKTAVGGARGGGTRITELGERVLRSYRDLQVQVEYVLDRASAEFAKGVGE
jgi:molybdate transport system regulatory protein